MTRIIYGVEHRYAGFLRIDIDELTLLLLYLNVRYIVVRDEHVARGVLQLKQCT
jgi:hypothetical protein